MINWIFGEAFQEQCSHNHTSKYIRSSYDYGNIVLERPNQKYKLLFTV